MYDDDDPGPLREEEIDLAKLEQQAGYAALRGDVEEVKLLRGYAAKKRLAYFELRKREQENKAEDSP